MSTTTPRKTTPAKKAAATKTAARPRMDINTDVRPVKKGDTPPSLAPKAIESYVVERATVSARDKQLAG